MIEQKELEKRFKDYMTRYYQGYSELSKEEEYMWLEQSIPSYLAQYYRQAYNNPMIGDNIFFQIFSGIDVLEPKYNPFFQMVERIENEYGLDRDIIDVGCGYFPALSYEISKRKKELGIEKGKIIAYDDKLVTTTLNGIILIKDKFTIGETIASKNTLVVGRKPCKATEELIKFSSINNLEFYMQICQCSDHIPREFKLNHKTPDNISIAEIYAEKIARENLPTGFIMEKEIIQERVGDSPRQISDEVIIKTKKMR